MRKPLASSREIPQPREEAEGMETESATEGAKWWSPAKYWERERGTKMTRYRRHRISVFSPFSSFPALLLPLSSFPVLLVPPSRALHRHRSPHSPLFPLFPFSSPPLPWVLSLSHRSPSTLVGETPCAAPAAFFHAHSSSKARSASLHGVLRGPLEPPSTFVFA